VDPRVKKAISAKIDEAASSAHEVRAIRDNLGMGKSDDFAFGIAVGRIYNSFHYQTRRILGRDATDAEFEEFVSLLSGRVAELRKAFAK
jgi:hypothetical protein